MYQRPAPTPYQWSSQPPPRQGSSPAPPLPPKPELRSLSTNGSGSDSWSGQEFVASPGAPLPPHHWPAPPPHSSPLIPRVGSVIPPEQIRSLDSGRLPEPESAGPSPKVGPYALAPPTPPQMRGTMPTPASPYISLEPRSTDGLSPPQLPWVHPSQQSYFSSPSPTLPPPPPPPANRPFVTTPAPPGHAQLPPPPPALPPPPPPLPTHRSEPQVPSVAQAQPNSTHARHQSLPPFPPPPPATPAPPPPAPASTPAPSFPQPFGPSHGINRTGSQVWVGGIAPRPSPHFRPFQPDLHNMLPIPEATMPGPPPPPPLPTNPPIQIPMPQFAALSVGASLPPPLPPPPRHAVTSPTVMSHSQWGSGGLRRTGSINPNAPPLPPKEPVPPSNAQDKEHSRPFQQQEPKEPPIPPKEPIEPSASTEADTSHASPPSRTMSIDAQNEAALRAALRMSLAVPAPVENEQEEEEDPELERAMRESIREISGSVSGTDLWGGTRTPELPHAQSSEVSSTCRTRQPPPLPVQSDAPVPSPQPETRAVTPRVVESPAAEVHPLQGDEPPPPTYEEVTGSRTATPSEPPLALAEPIQAVPLFGSGSPRERNTQDSSQGGHVFHNMNASMPEPPVAIEVTPPTANNTIVMRGSQPGGHGRPGRSSSEGDAPSVVPNEMVGNPLHGISGQSPPLNTARPRTSPNTRPRPSTEYARQPELSFAHPRVASTSQANPGSRLGRASMFFGMSASNPNATSNDPPPRRTWAIDEGPGTENGLLLQAPEPASSNGLLRSRNTSDVALHDSLADAPSTETLLDGVVYGFRDPDPPTPIPMPPADPFPPNIALDDSGAFHIQTQNFRHLLRLLSHYGTTKLMATPAAIATSKSGVHALRVVLHFVRGPHERDPWHCRLFLELHTPPENGASPPADTSLLFPGSQIVAPCGPRGKLYVIPGPQPQLPLSFQSLSIFLTNRLEEARRSPRDSSQRRLERLLVECYGSVTGAAASKEEIGGRQKGSGNLRSLGGIFAKVKGKLSPDKGETTNFQTYDLISPFHIEDYR